MKTGMTGSTTKTFSVRLSYEDIMKMFKDGGYEFNGYPKIDIARRNSNSVIENKLGDIKTQTQSLHLSVTVTEEFEG
jgi:hypothetical protein